MGDFDRPNVGYDALLALRSQGHEYWLMKSEGGYNWIYADVGTIRRYYAQSTSDRMIVYGYWTSYDDLAAWVSLQQPKPQPPQPEPKPEPTKGSLEVHVFEDGSEVAASVEIIGVGTRSTPFSESLDAGSYDLSVTFKGVVKTDTVVIVASETTRADYKYTAPVSTPSATFPSTDSEFPFKNLSRFPRLYKFVYGLWAKRKGKT